MARRTQAERSATTRAALVAAGRELFAAHGFAAVGTEEIGRAAGVTRGALYHHFADKTELFEAVLDDAEAEVALRMVAAIGDVDPADTGALLLAGADAFLDACADPALGRIVLIDGPAVLGWAGWREVCLRHSVGLVEAALADGMERGTIVRQPLRPLAHLLIGATDEAAMYVAQSADPERARAEVMDVLGRLVAVVAPA